MTTLALVIVSALGGAPTDVAVEHAVEVYHCDFGPQVDRDYDGWPDGWTRRRGGEFYEFLKIGLEAGADGREALRVGMNGGAATVYSPKVEITSRFSYLLQADIRTEGVQYEGAFVVLSLYDAAGTLLEKHSSPVVTFAANWQTVNIGPVTPTDARVCQAVISLHVEPQANRHDLSGSVWFSNLRLSRLPRITVRAGNDAHFFSSLDEVEVYCELSGITQPAAEIDFELYDLHGVQIATHQDRLVFTSARNAGTPFRVETGLSAGTSRARIGEGLLDGFVGRATWRPKLPGYGFYRVYVSLHGEGQSSLSRSVTLVVAPPVPRSPRGEFGWSLAGGEVPMELGPLSTLLAEAGVHWAKYPVWFAEQDTAEADRLAWFAERLSLQRIELVGVLDRIPKQFDAAGRPLRAEFIADAMDDAQSWKGALNPVMTRLSLKVRYWQLGDDRDLSLVGYPNLEAKINELRSHMKYFSPEIRIGFGWKWVMPPPRTQTRAWEFLSMQSDPPLTAEEIGVYLSPSGDEPKSPLPRPAEALLTSAAATAAPRPQPRASPAAPQHKAQRWLMVEPLPRRDYDLTTRARDLVMRMVSAKVHDADAIFAPHPFDDERGLMNRDGTPGELFLPWRTTALALAGAEHIGSWQLPGGSANHVFVRDGQAVMVVWNDQPVTERMYFGEDVIQLDIWGRQERPPTVTTDDFPEQEVSVGPLPTFLLGLSETVARWQVGLTFDRTSLESVFGREQTVRLNYRNVTRQSFGGSIAVQAPKSWSFFGGLQRFKLAENDDLDHALRIVLQQDANSGPQPLRLDVTLTAERNYRFRVYRTLQLGLDDVKIEMTTRLREDGTLIVEQRLTNLTDEFVSFQSVLFPPGRRRETRQVMNLGRGKNTVTFMLPRGEELIGQKLRLRAEEIGGSRILNYTVTAER